MTVMYCAKGTNPNYFCTVVCPSINAVVICDLPEQINVGVSSEWESRLPFTLSEALTGIPVVGGIAQNIQNVLGVNAGYQDTSFQMWMGTSPIELPLTLLFDAKTDAYKDVFMPIQILTGMALPNTRDTGSFMGRSIAGTILTAPGPVRGGGAADDGSVEILVGRMLHFQKCIVVSVNQTLDSRMDANGYPISGQVEIVFRTSIVYGKGDWLKVSQVGQP